MHKKGKGWVLTHSEALNVASLAAATMAYLQASNKGLSAEQEAAGQVRLITLLKRVLPLVAIMVEDESLRPELKAIRDSIDAEVEEFFNEQQGNTERQATGSEQASGPEDGNSGRPRKWQAPDRRPVNVADTESSWHSVSPEQVEACPEIGTFAECPHCKQLHPVEERLMGPEQLHVVRCPEKEGSSAILLVGVQGKDITRLRSQE